MRKIYILTFIGLNFLCAKANNPLVGFMLGHPTAISVRQKIDRTHSWDAGLGYSLLSEGLSVHGDYLWDRARVFNASDRAVEFFYGVGGRFETYGGGHDRDWALGPRLPFGLSMDFNSPDLQVFGEIAPIIDLLPNFDVEAHVALGLRYRF